MKKVYTILELPRTYFEQEYVCFCFEVLCGTTPFALFLETVDNEMITIKDLNKLHGYFDNDGNFIEDRRSYGLFVEFLKSITVYPNAIGGLPMHHDIAYVKEKFFIDMRIKEADA